MLRIPLRRIVLALGILGPIEPEAIAHQPIVRVWLAVEMIEPIAPTW
jgi:hypothetical protein